MPKWELRRLGRQHGMNPMAGAATEKIGYLPRKLSTVGAPAGTDPATGDVTYYAPWGNLALFHKDFRYSIGLIPLGEIESGLEALREPGSVTATIELID